MMVIFIIILYGVDVFLFFKMFFCTF